MSASANVAERLVERAASDPSGLGLAALRRGRAWRASWSELDGRAGALAYALARAGLAPGERALVLSRPDVDWIVAIHAIWRAGAVPVLIDPGMGRASLLAACARIRPRAVVAGPRAQLAMRLWPRAFESVGLVVSIGHRIAPGARALERLERDAGGSLAPVARRGDDAAAILLTSGATGPPKGVLYTHANFGAQVAALRELYSIRPGEVDLACFAPFALFHAGLGIASVLPDIDFARPAACDPALVVRAIDEFAARQSFGSPAIWSRVVAWCEAKGRTLPLRRLMIAGAPVKPRLVARAVALLPDGEVHTPYGATEALPVADADGRTIEATRKLAESGAGTFVGRAAPGIEIALARVDDGPLERWSDAVMAPGAIGEICVRGAAVTRAYADDEPATALAKIDDGAGGFWHRMGDLGRFDEQGGLWFLGRKAHRLETARGMLCPVPLENVFDLHDYIERSALVGVGERGAERPWLVVEPRPDRLPRDKRLRAKLAGDILRTGAWFPPCAAVEGVLFKSELPVDPRHNAKIDRGALKRWAQDELA